MKRKQYTCVTMLAVLLGASVATAAGPSLWYGVSHLGGTQYRYDYTVFNDSATAVGGFTVDFVDSGLNALPDYQNVADVSSAAIRADWSTLVGDPVGTGAAASGYFDTSVVNLANAIPASSGLAGFAASFNWNAAGTPAAQQVTFYDPNGAVIGVNTSTIVLTLNAAAPAASGHKVDLSWTWSGPSGVLSGFRIERSEGSDTGPWGTVATISSASASGGSDTTAAPVKTYYYRVVASAASFDSPPSNALSATTPAVPDADGDGIEDALDNCPSVANPTQADSDHDGIGDACDGCPNDPAKTAPSVCGCGTADTDSDGDGVPDCLDNCPNDPGKTAPSACGCGKADTDSDGDGVPDCVDNCPSVPNPDQADSAGDGVGDACRPAAPPDNSSPQQPTVNVPVCGAGSVGTIMASVLGLVGLRSGRRRRG